MLKISYSRINRSCFELKGYLLSLISELKDYGSIIKKDTGLILNVLNMYDNDHFAYLAQSFIEKRNPKDIGKLVAKSEISKSFELVLIDEKQIFLQSENKYILKIFNPLINYIEPEGSKILSPGLNVNGEKVDSIYKLVKKIVYENK